MIVLYPHAVDPAYAPRQADTRKFLGRLRETHEDWSFVDLPCGPDRVPHGDYERGLGRVWGQDDLLIIEQDLVPLERVVEQMSVCKEPICCNIYVLHKCLMAIQHGSQYMHCIGHAIPMWAYRLRVPLPDGSFFWKWGAGKDKWAHRFCLGVTRFSRGYQENHPMSQLPEGDWADLDTRISFGAVKSGMLAHLHRPPATHNDKMGRMHNQYSSYVVSIDTRIPEGSPEWCEAARRVVGKQLAEHGDPLPPWQEVNAPS